MTPVARGPIGVFDSGVGGISVLNAIRRILPGEDLIYVADSAHLPYGEKPRAYIEARAQRLAAFFLEQGAKAIAIPCNTATAAAVDALRRRYWQRYGATLIGMVKHHGVSAAEFLHRSHNFDVRPLVRTDKDLRNRLSRLPGRKVLLTNAPHNYARTILSHLGILHCFDALWAVEDMYFHGEFRVKPSTAMLRHVMAMTGVSPHNAVLVEDTSANLRAARKVGMRTVLVRHPGTPFAKSHRGRPLFIDLQVNSVSHLLLQRRALRRS